MRPGKGRDKEEEEEEEWSAVKKEASHFPIEKIFIVDVILATEKARALPEFQLPQAALKFSKHDT